MSLDKAVLHKKEHRKPYYRGPKRVSKQCRDGRCPSCRANDLYANKKRIDSANSRQLP
jgi:hypothetical protein